MRHASEAQEAKAFVQYMAYAHPDIPVVHIPNEARRSVAGYVELAKQGVRKGFPDYMILTPNIRWSALFIELKTKKGKLTEAQEEWIRKLIERGYYASVARGCEEAINVFEDYIRGKL